MWPWKRRVIEAQQQQAEAERRNQEAHELAARSRQVTARYRREINENGFTRMLQEAWGKRA